MVLSSHSNLVCEEVSDPDFIPDAGVWYILLENHSIYSGIHLLGSKKKLGLLVRISGVFFCSCHIHNSRQDGYTQIGNIFLLFFFCYLQKIF